MITKWGPIVIVALLAFMGFGWAVPLYYLMGVAQGWLIGSTDSYAKCTRQMQAVFARFRAHTIVQDTIIEALQDARRDRREPWQGED